MLILLSPAKSLDFESPSPIKDFTDPRYTKHSAALMKVLRKMKAEELMDLMNLSESLGKLNADRNLAWKQTHDADNSKSALFAFQGDVYQGLDAGSLKSTVVRRCQKHVRILSGLYGILKPLDLIQPYRLEMGSRLKTDRGKDLYAFWGDTIRDGITEDLSSLKSTLVINLASNEYSRAARLGSLDATVVAPQFKDWKNGQFKMISFFAKRARGLMTRYLMENKIADLDGLQGFDLDGYQYNAELSTDTKPMFTRKQAD